MLKGKEVPFYLNVKNGDFWYDGTALIKIPAAGVSNQPSEDVPYSDEDNEMDCADYTNFCDEVYEIGVNSVRSDFRPKPEIESHSKTNRNTFSSSNLAIKKHVSALYDAAADLDRIKNHQKLPEEASSVRSNPSNLSSRYTKSCITRQTAVKGKNLCLDFI